jgi:GntR family phosphonate transport system transcriptional regulator
MGYGFLTEAAQPRILWEQGRAVWRQIEDCLVADIAAGRFQPGAQLPTEKELADRFEVNRHTVRRALAAVADRGLILTEQGRGSFVVNDAIDYAVGPHTRFTENILAQGGEPETDTLGAREEPAGDKIARHLKIRPRSRVVVVETLRHASGRPIAFGRHYYPARRVPHFIAVFERLRSVSATLRDCGVKDFTRAFTRVSARLPNQDEAQMLRIARNVPLLVSEAVNIEPNGRPIELVFGHFAADRVHFTMKP